MRFLLFLLGFGLLSALCLLGENSQAQEVASPSVVFAPHRALYTLTLGSVKTGGVANDVSGQIAFEWQDVCDGWAIQQRMDMHIVSSEGDEQNIRTQQVTWEAKDGSAYRFNMRNEQDGQEPEIYKGKAVRNPKKDAVTVSYVLPTPKTVSMPLDTLFPTAHMALILNQARHPTGDGIPFFFRRVFDGSDSEGVSDVSALILSPRRADQEKGLSKTLKALPLLSGDSWPLSMAFFNIKGQTETPAYEMKLSLMPSGIARAVDIDYQTFTVTGTLTEFDALPPLDCPSHE